MKVSGDLPRLMCSPWVPSQWAHPPVHGICPRDGTRAAALGPLRRSQELVPKPLCKPPPWAQEDSCPGCQSPFCDSGQSAAAWPRGTVARPGRGRAVDSPAGLRGADKQVRVCHQLLPEHCLRVGLRNFSNCARGQKLSEPLWSSWHEAQRWTGCPLPRCHPHPLTDPCYQLR